MNTFRSCALIAALVTPAFLCAQSTPLEGTISIGGGGFQQSGSRSTFQEHLQLNKSGFGGIEDLRLSKTLKDDSTLAFNGRFNLGNADYLFNVKWTKDEIAYLNAGFKQFRVWYDGTGTYFPPTGSLYSIFDESLHVDRGSFWVEAGTLRPDSVNFKFRYEHQTRQGNKGSTMEGDVNLPVFGTRSIVPSIYKLDETRDILTFNADRKAENYMWGAGARYDRSKIDDRRYANRQPGLAADRKITSKDEISSDMFSVHAFTEYKVSERLTFSTGGLVTSLDTNLGGSRIYGQTYDPVYDPAYVRRQQRDEGFYGLGGGSQLKQYVMNANVVYRPHKHWTIRPTLRVEDYRLDNISHFVETNVGAGPAFAAILEDLEGESRKEWLEFTEAIDARYTGHRNWTHTVKAEWLQGDGNLEEQISEHHVPLVDRDTDLSRKAQKYSYTASWYARPGLTLSGQYYYKVRVNDYDPVRDNTPNTSADRYPAYITDQDFDTHDYNVRLHWRPASLLSFVTRYDYQRSTVTSTEAALNEVESSRYESHIIAQSVSVNPLPRLYVTANASVTYDQIDVPYAIQAVKDGDNNYFTASLSAGFAATKIDDLYLDYSRYQADNFIDNSAASTPYGRDEEQDVVSLTWVRRQSERVTYTMKYTYANYSDDASGGYRDYEAHGLYGRVQYGF